MNPCPPGHCWQVIWASSVDGQTMYPATDINDDDDDDEDLRNYDDEFIIQTL